MKQRKSLDQWRTILAEYERSNQTQAVFCRKRGLKLATFQYHRQRQRRRDGGAAAQRVIEIRPDDPAPMLPPPGGGPASADAELRIEIPLSCGRNVILRCALTQLPEVIAQLTLASPRQSR